MKISKNLRVIVGLTVVILLSGVTWAFASDGGTIYACANPAGQVRIVSDLDECRSQETPLYWSITGPKGDQGDPGAPGPKGDPGANGLNCWDLNSNGVADSNEDANSDGVFDALDCQGPKGDTGSLDLVALCNLEVRIHAMDGSFEFSPECIEDLDGDGYTIQTDCRDDLAMVNPGQTGWFSEPLDDGTYDYNCSGYSEREWYSVARWVLTYESCLWGYCTRHYTSSSGWIVVPGSSAPSCSQTGNWHDGSQQKQSSGSEPTVDDLTIDGTKEQRCH